MMSSSGQVLEIETMARPVNHPLEQQKQYWIDVVTARSAPEGIQ
jgi:hypothetical protein